MRQRLFRWMLSKAFRNLDLNVELCLPFVHCSMMLHSGKIWSMDPLPFRKPACSSLSCWSIASFSRWMIIFLRILFGMDRSVIPRQLLLLLKASFFGIFAIMLCVQSVDISFPSRMVVKSARSISAASSRSSVNNSALRFSCPGAFLF